MMRRDDWLSRLIKALEKHRDIKPQWGVSDCWIMGCDAYEAVTGDKLLPQLRGYDSEKSGYRLFAKLGFQTVGEALASQLPVTAPLQAMRGDLGVVVRGGVESVVVITGDGALVKTANGQQTLKLTELKAIYKVN